MTPKEIEELIKILPDILIYVVPGAIFLYIHYFICSNEDSKENEKHFIFKSIILSFIIVNFLKLLGKPTISFIEQITGLQVNKTIVSFKIALILIASIILSYLLSQLYLSAFFQKLLNFLGINKSIHSKWLNDIVDLELGTGLRVYLPSERIIYCGKLRKYEEKDENYMIFLSNFSSHTYDSEEKADFTESNESWVALNTKDISRFELFYYPNSQKIL